MLPGPLAWIKKLLRILKSNLSPNQIALSFSLGIFAGLPPMGLHVIIPAFMLGELKRAFVMGLMIFIPFVVIDMAVATVLMSMGMMMMPPVVISLPCKLLLFVLIDGWTLVTNSVVSSFH